MSYVSSIERRGIEKHKVEVAKRLLKEKVSPSIIKKATGLSVEKIKELKKKKSDS